MAHFVGIRYTLAFAGVHQQTSGGWLCRSGVTAVSQDQVCFFYMSLIVSHVNESWIDVHMSISAHAYMHMVCMHTWCSKMLSSNPTLCHKCGQYRYIGGGVCLNPQCVSTLVVFEKIELCKVFCSCVFFFKWHFSFQAFLPFLFHSEHFFLGGTASLATFKKVNFIF